MSAHARYFDFVVVGDQTTKGAAKISFQALGFPDGRSQTRRDVAGDVVAARGDDACMGDAAFNAEQEIRRAAADVDDGDADLFFVFGQHRFRTGKGFENDVRYGQTTTLGAPDNVLHAAGRRGN